MLAEQSHMNQDVMNIGRANSMYAIMVKFDGEWTYVTADGAARPVLYKTSSDAEEVAEQWRLTGKEHNIKVVVYGEHNES